MVINYFLFISFIVPTIIAEDGFDDFFQGQLDGDIGYDKDYVLYAPDGKNFVKNVINVEDGMVSFKQGRGPQESMTFDPKSGLVKFGAKIPPCRDGFERAPTGFCVPFPEEEEPPVTNQKRFRIQRPVRRHGPRPIPMYITGRMRDDEIEDQNPCNFCKDYPCGKIVKCTHYVKV